MLEEKAIDNKWRYRVSFNAYFNQQALKINIDFSLKNIK